MEKTLHLLRFKTRKFSPRGMVGVRLSLLGLAAFTVEQCQKEIGIGKVLVLPLASYSCCYQVISENSLQ